MNKQYFRAGLLLTALAFNACKEEDEDPVTPGCKEQAIVTNGLINTGENMYLVNEGNFTSGNGTIGFYNSTGSNQSKYTADLFKPANCATLGSSVQSLTFHNGKGYITVQGNTGKVEVVDSATFVRQATITSISAPQYLEPVSATKAYVTNWDFSNPVNEVVVLDLNTNTETKRIPVNSLPYQMLTVGNEVWLAYAPFANDTRVTVINPQTDAVTTQVQLERDSVINYDNNPTALGLDANGKLWVLCAGIDDFTTPANNTPGGLFQLDPATRQVMAAFPFSSNATHPRYLALSPDRTQLYYEYNGSVYKIAANATALPTIPFISSPAGYFYGLSVSPTTGNIYVSDASFTGNSRVLVYSATGQSLGEITTGVGTNKVVFK